MARSDLLSLLLVFATVMTSQAPADEISPATGRKLLGESSGEPVARACTLPNCATIISIRYGDLQEYGPTARVQGPVSRQPPFGPYNPHVPPITQPGFMVRKQKDAWVIELQRRDGTTQSIEQSFPVLFQVGDEVIVEGDHIRAPD
ncbi:MAG TPA: hypothetical protein VMH32_14910 [Burkholderiales bacterium]|nr:hypothetical protein [Burkholderiales bacterium]